MDIKTLLHNLREEVSCPVCTNVYTDPKHLPCLHTFCLQCLKHTTSHGRDTIRCPKCQAISRVPKSGDLRDLPTSFYLNGLIDVLAIKEWKISQVRCDNCDEKSSESSYCFHCCVFWCEKCIIGQNIVRSNKDHRVLALNNVKTEDIGTLKKPTKAGHCDIEGKGLEEGIALREAHFTLTTKDTDGRQCYNEGDHVTVEIRDEQGRECTSEIQMNDCKDGLYHVRYCLRDPVKCQVTVKVNGHSQHIGDSPFPVQVTPFQFKPILSFGKEGSSKGMFSFLGGVAVNAKNEIAVADSNNHRVQIFNSEGNYLRSFGRHGTKEEEFRSPIGITYHNNGNIFVVDYGNNKIQIFSGKGEYVGSFGGRGSLDSQLSDPVSLSVDSDGNIIVADSGNKLIKIFSPDGNFLTKIGEQCSFTLPLHCIQYERYLIVSDYGEHCIKVFDRKGNFQYKFGKKGGGDGELNSPRSLLVNKSGHLMVCDENNHRIQVFELNGKFLGKFGIKGGNLGEFNHPTSLAVLSNGQIIVCDSHNDRIQILE